MTDGYTWDAYQDNGLVISRWDLDGSEQTADPWRTRQFHCYAPADPKTSQMWLSVPRGAYFHWVRRRLLGAGDERVIYIAGWEWPDPGPIGEGRGCFLFLPPWGPLELADHAGYVTRFERDWLP